MKTLIPLRTTAIGSNIAFVVYGYYDSIHLVLVLHAILLPLNAMLRLIRRVEPASKGDFSTEWLKPFMKEAALKAGETIFNKGDYADRLYMIIAGDIHLEQIDHILRARRLVRRDRTIFCRSSANPNGANPNGANND
jgi:CRP/FNR family transcriptional regulator, cyclic AMP receptor protein